MKRENKNRIIVAMSGGVDSSVAAALLKKQGHDVIGVFMKFWKPKSFGKSNENRCCTLESERMARLVAKKLDIPFYVLNLEREFKKKVVDYFLKENRAGRTPNPCVVCNKEIKFGLLLEKAFKLDAAYVATGHYVQIYKEPKTQSCVLLKGEDKDKDQSYFLWKLNQKQLKHILFPVGNYTKSKVRELAKKFKLPNAKTLESQEICFVDAEINSFLRKYLREKTGNIVDLSGNILGSHHGLWFYTIGQRRGIGIASGKPYYVLSKNIKKNELVISQNEKDLVSRKLIAGNINWISGVSPKFPIRVTAKIRYRTPGQSAIVKKVNSNFYSLDFLKPQRAITPGQSVVFYSGKKLIGGGIIKGNG
ncbi:MAG: tRNA 2-thiouridine(34) synthase MnmA [Candidatus Staskawiczbacteria bacterium]|jgi:tRNA-specific 2-thiouridylase